MTRDEVKSAAQLRREQLPAVLPGEVEGGGSVRRSAIAAGLLRVYGTVRRRRAELRKPTAASYLHSVEKYLDSPGVVKKVFAGLRAIGGRGGPRRGWAW